MKKLILNFILYIAISSPVFSQVSISNPVRLTSGNNDRNPSFGNNRVDFSSHWYDWEFMVFERIIAGSSNILVTKIGDSGSVGGDHSITNDLFINRNPSIAYNQPAFGPGSEIKYAVVIWQSNKFGRQSIFGSRYVMGNGWSLPFIVDSSNSENILPKICSIDSINYSIVYQSDNDIKYKKYNILANVFSMESNLTASDPINCSNPQIKATRFLTGETRIYVPFEREITPGHKAIYYATGLSDTIPDPANLTDTIAFAGNNRNLGFGNDKLSHNIIFESDRNGVTTNIYGSSIWSQQQNEIISDFNNDCINYIGGDFGITDNGTHQNMINAYNFISSDKLYIKISFTWWHGYTVTHKISNNPLYQTTISISSSIRVPNTTCERHWFVYNQDSLNSNFPSTIYGVYYTNCLTEISQNENSVPGEFSLSQNFPNPFNPKTIINYELRITNYATIKVFDINGKEIATLVDEKQNPGSYSVEWDGTNFSSGVYFYRITAGEFSEVKKMTLLK